jgi:hypothetical protein
MEIYTMTQRPSMPLTRACAPSAVPATSPAAGWKTALLTAPVATPVAVLAAERAPVSRVHQVQVQAELAQALTLTSGINGTTGTTSTTGFKGIDGSKRYTDGAKGVPPRGRPV